MTTPRLCFICGVPTELPTLYPYPGGFDAAGQVWYIDVPECLECAAKPMHADPEPLDDVAPDA